MEANERQKDDHCGTNQIVLCKRSGCRLAVCITSLCSRFAGPRKCGELKREYSIFFITIVVDMVSVMLESSLKTHWLDVLDLGFLLLNNMRLYKKSVRLVG